jgi:hypothetical protein
MNVKALMVAVILFGGVLGAAAYMTVAQKLSTPPVIKRSIRADSPGHGPIHRGIRHGK